MKCQIGISSFWFRAVTQSDVKLRARGEALLVVLATGLFAAGLCFVRPMVFESVDYVLY